MNSFLPIGFHVKPCNATNGIKSSGFTKLLLVPKGVYPFLLITAFALLQTFSNNLNAQSTNCVVDSVGNGNTDPWSEECYLNDDCEEQGNPCQANDVTLLGVFVADSAGGPVPACTMGDTVEVLLWGRFSNNTGTNRYAIRSRVEVWISGNFFVELNSCSFDVLAPGMTDVALVGTFDYVCGSQIQLFNTWIAWSTSASQCEDPMAPNFNDVCGEYSPSKCSKSLQFIDFLSPNFSYTCGESDPGTTELCFTNLTTGGVPPLTYAWDFGDGGMSTEENPCHTYNATTGSFTVTLEVTDSTGIMASTELQINLDSIVCCDLVITCPSPDGGVFVCIEDIPAADTSLIIVTDSCGAVTTTFDEDTIGTGCGLDTMYITRTYFVNDGTLTDSCVQIFRVNDNLAPTITCPVNVTLECTDSTLPNSTAPGMATATDNCGGTPLVSFTDVTVASIVCPQEYTINRTWLATDACGNTNTCIQIITVDDSTPPVITCPANLTVSCDENTLPPGTGSATAMDNCDASVTPTFSDLVIPSIVCSQEATILRTWTATDDCGNSATCIQTILVDDSTPPVITCPVNVTIDCAAITLSAGTPVVMDNCDPAPAVTFVDLTVSVGSCLQEVIISRTWTATDDCGNSSTCIQTLSLTDTLPPAIICPPDATLECSESTAPNSTVPGMAIATDSCDLIPVITFSDVTVGSACPQEYTIMRTWTATDDCDNSSTCVQTISVEDNTAPVLSCPVSITVDCEDSTLPPATGEGTAIDNCDTAPVVDFSDEIIEGICPQEFTVMRTWTATDACMNSSTCLQIVSVQDTTPPSFNPDCQAELEFFTSDGSDCPADAMVSLEVGDIVGEAEMWTVGGNTIPGLNGCLFDNCGNPDSLEARVDSIVITGDSCLRVISIHFTILNDCDSLNVNLFTTVVSIIDDAPPVIDCPEDMTIDCAGSSSPDVTGMATATDNCQLVGLSSSDMVIPGECPQEMTIIRTWTADDNCGNSSTCIQTLTVIDTTPPVLICPEVTTPVECSDSGTPMVLFQEDFDGIGGPTAGGAGTYTFPAGWLKRNVDNMVPNAAVSYVNEAWERREDFSFNVADSAAFSTSWYNPVGTANDWMWTPAIGVLANSTLSWNAVTYDPLFRDGYEVRVMVSPDIPTGGTGVIGNQITNSTVVFSIAEENTTWTARNISLAAYAGQTVYIGFRNNSNDKFLLLIDDISVTAQASGPVFADATAIDACDPEPVITFTDVSIEGACPQENIVTRTWIATDACGNSSTCSATIEVIDTTGPVIVCPADLTIECQNSTQPDSTGFAIPRDNCDSIPVVTFSDLIIESQECSSEYSITRTWVATDACGNSSSCTQLIQVEDNTPPLISCPADLTINCEESTVPDSTGIATAIDDCQLDVAITSADSIVPGECPQEMVIFRTWVAGDSCGNIATCIQMITVEDNTSPEITCPEDITVEFGAGEFMPAIDFGTLTDFALFTAAGAFNNLGPTIVTGDIGTHVGTITGFPPGVVIGEMHEANGETAQAATDVAVAYGQLSAITCGVVLGPTLGNGQVLTPDTYCVGAASTVNLNLILDAQGDPNAVFIFKINGALSTSSFSNVILINGASSCNVYWQINGAFAAGDNSIFRGNLFVAGAISLNFGAELEGRALSTAGAISTNSNTVNSITQCNSGIIGMATATDNCDSTLLLLYTDDIAGGECCQDFFITRTWIATDACGNSSTCTQLITVEDTTPPDLTCPSDIIVDCGDSTLPPDTGDVLPVDSCEIVTSVDSIIAGECPQEMTILRTWTVDDGCGNSSTCIQTISVVDTIAPVVDTICNREFDFYTSQGSTCPFESEVSILINILSGIPIGVNEEWTVGNNVLPSLAGCFTDNCNDPDSLIVLASSFQIEGDSCDATFTVIFNVQDECGNASEDVIEYIIRIHDDVAPVVTCPADVTIDCTASTDPDSLGLATAVDDCRLIVAITSVDTIVPGECPQEMTILRTWTADDGCGNSSSCVQTISVQDTTPPVATFIPPDITIECDANIDSVLAELPIFADNCDTLVPAFGSIEVLFNEACPQGPTYIQAWSGIDDCGNSTTVGRTVVVIDTTAPVIVCPADLTIECTDDTSPDSNGVAIATDNCDSIPVVDFSDVTIAGECPQEYTISRTWTATDECENTSTCVQTIVVDDSTPPVITCPAAVTVECANLLPPPSINSVSATDNCGIAVIAHIGDALSGMTCVNRFTVTRTYSATDECGNISTCTQMISVFDDTPPAITCPANVTVQCAAQVPPVNPAAVISSDNCGGIPVNSHVGDVITNMTCANRFTLTRTYRATDECGNSSTCNQTITVFDNTPPMITCPANITVQCANQVPAPNTGLVVSSDNCAGATTVTHVGDVITNMTCVNRFTLTRTYRATDVCGNSATCNQVITVFDNTPPTITCPANITVQCAALVPPNNPATVITSDNCGGSPVVTFVSDVITNMTCINRFTLTRTYRSTDACGNSATCAQVITVFDNTPPVIEFADVLIDDIPPGGTLEVQCFGQDPEWELPVFDENSVDVTDNCAGNITVTFSQVLIDEGDCEVDGYINRYRLTWNATDACGNSSSAFIFMELIDTIPPVIEGVPADTIVNCDEIPEPPTVFATDECLCACVILFEQSDPAPGCQDGQVITRTWTATDDCGNETVEVQFITLVDEEGPVLEIMLPELAGITQDTTFEYTCNEGGIPAFFDELSAEWVSSPVSCGGLPVISFTSNTLTPRNCKFFGYVEQRKYEWIGVDQCGNQTTLSVTVHLIDNEPPVLVGVPEMACIGEEIENVEAIDNCGNGAVIYWDVPIPNPCGDGMAMRRTYEGFDPCGNTVRDTTIMIPNDHAHPLMEFINPILADLEPGEMLQMDCDAENGQFTSFGTGDVRVEDACFGGVTITFTETVLQEGDCTNGESVALLELSWLASDVCGNLSELVVMARISDQTPPMFIDTDDDITIGCNDELPDFFAVDNCGEVTMTTQDSIIPGDCEFEYTMLRELTATDECGNVNVMLQTIHVGDGSGPILEGVVEELCDDVSIPEVTAFDPCAGVFVEVSMTEDTLDLSCRDGFVLERIWTAFDVCGNSTEVVQHIVVGDESAPEILIPTHSVIRRFIDIPEIQLINLSQGDIMNLLNELDDASIFVTDDCDQVIVPEFFVNITYAEDCEEEGFFEHRVYTWIATDVCGNSTSISFEVDIMDDIAPAISDVPEDTTIICQQLPPAPGITTEDHAEPVTVEYTQTIIETPMGGVFVVVRTWVATDACGNSSSASQTINWIPDTFLECDIVLPSEVECNSHGILIESDISGGLGALTYMWEIEGEKCFIQEGQGTPSILIYVGWSDVEITLTVTDEFGCVSTCSIVLPCVDPVETVIGTEPQSRNTGSSNVPGLNTFTKGYLDNLSLWPNPTNGNVNFSFESPIEQDIRISLTDMMGQEIMSKIIPAHKGLNTRKIESAQFPEGSYLLQIVSQHESHSKVLVILHN